MLLEARSTNCFSGKHLLKLDGRPIGRFRGRWLNSNLEIELVERLRLRFESSSWLGGKYRLLEATSGNVLAKGRSVGIFSNSWNLDLQCGQSELVHSSFFSSIYEIRKVDQTVAQISRIGFCEGGWQVEAYDTMEVTDLVFAGLIFHKILQQQSRDND